MPARQLSSDKGSGEMAGSQQLAETGYCPLSAWSALARSADKSPLGDQLRGSLPVHSVLRGRGKGREKGLEEGRLSVDGEGREPLLSIALVLHPAKPPMFTYSIIAGI